MCKISFALLPHKYIVGGGNIVHIFHLSHHKGLCAQLRVPGKLAMAGQKHSETSYMIHLVHSS